MLIFWGKPRTPVESPKVPLQTQSVGSGGFLQVKARTPDPFIGSVIGILADLMVRDVT
jgi:hypothetical protein